MGNGFKRGRILGTGRFLPEKVLTNFDLEKMVETSDEWITSRTGIRERRIADEDVCTSDMATNAARIALERAGITAEQLDLIIVATCTPDYIAFPSTACIVQKNLGASKAAAFDLEAACSGFVYGSVIANQFIATGMYKYCLVIGAETLSRIVNWEDRNTCILFGDGAGAAVIGPSEDERGILSSALGADGNGGSFLEVVGGGARQPASAEVLAKKLNTIRMDGNDVFKFAVRVMESATIKVLNDIGKGTEDIDYLIPHQANIRIVNASAKRLNLPTEKVAMNLDRYANTSAATVPIALDEAIEFGKINDGDLVVLVGFGAGLTWAAATVQW